MIRTQHTVPGFYRRMLVLAIPIALQSMITMGVNMMDTITVTAHCLL